MLTKKIKQHSADHLPKGFLSWNLHSLFEQREIGSFSSIGRDDSQTIVMDDPFVSRRHARIENKEGEFVLMDMNSRNGTFLNNNRIFKAVLRNNDCIKIGQTEFTFSFKKPCHNHKLFNQSLNVEWRKQLSRISSMAQSEFPVLIHGPSGTGKEHLAQMIHTRSSRSSGPYISVNCSALAETLAESEFFGHIKGSYTGADQNRKGAFLSAHKGTLFLDEIGDLPLSIQPKLLRALESCEIKPVGSDQIAKVDVRVVSATHQDLEEKVMDKKFREDLYFRLRVLEIIPPALKERMEDFANLLQFYSEKFDVLFSLSAQKKLKNYSWPGNIRELKNTVARAKALFPNELIQEHHIKDILFPVEKIYIAEKYSKRLGRVDEISKIRNKEKEFLVNILKENQGNKRKTAQQLGMARSTLIYRLRHYGIQADCEK